MSGLEDAARDARARADVSLDPADHAVANALESALNVERAKGHEPADLAGIEPPQAAGFASDIKIPPGEAQN